MVQTQEMTVRNTVGLHARPAAVFVKTAARFASRITLNNVSKGTQPVNAKSILSVLSIAVQMNDRICIVAEGDDEEQALAALRDLIESNFGETE